MFSMRTYLGVGIVVGILVFILANFFGISIANWLLSVQSQAQAVGMGGLAVFIAEPLIWIMRNPILGALASGALWPLLLIWIVLVFVMLLVAFGADAAREVEGQI